MVEIVKRSDDYIAKFGGYWESGLTVAQAYINLTNQPAVDVREVNIQIGDNVVSYQDAWALAERF